MLDQSQLRPLRWHLKNNRANLETLGEGMSRRIEGEWMSDAEVEVQGYGAVFVYAQCGLGDKHELFAEVLTLVFSIQSESRLKYPLSLFSFGWDDGNLRHADRAQETYHRGGLHHAKELAELCGTQPAASGIVPALIPPNFRAGGKRRITDEDLLVFFCRDRAVQMPAEVLAQYQRARRRAVWFFLDDAPLDFERNFTPAVSP